MKSINEGFAARLSGSVLTTCLCWKLQREDGLIVGITDHDRSVEHHGILYAPGAAVEAGRFETAGGLRPGRAARASASSGSIGRPVMGCSSLPAISPT